VSIALVSSPKDMEKPQRRHAAHPPLTGCSVALRSKDAGSVGVLFLVPLTRRRYLGTIVISIERGSCADIALTPATGDSDYREFEQRKEGMVCRVFEY
jgi:hypothetical protein